MSEPGTQPEVSNEPSAEIEEAAVMGNFAEQIEGLLEKLVPPDEVEITYVDGTKALLPGAISARRQIKVFRIMRELLEMPTVQNALRAGSTTSGIIDVLVSLTTDEAIAEKLGLIFMEAYPEALPEGTDPLDVLPLEELATAIVPFSERFVSKVGKGMLVLSKVAN